VATFGLNVKISPPLVSLSVVSHGDGPELLLLLESLASHERQERFQLLVTDNVSPDLPDIPPAGWHSIVMLRPSRPRGFASNHNAAFQRASGTFFCVLNPDLIFEGSVFSTLIQRLEGGEGHIAAPALVDSRGVIQDSFRSLPSPWQLIIRRLGVGSVTPTLPKGQLVHPDWIAGTFMLMRRETFSDLGGFDARYRLYFEDVDLCTRARLMGLSILVDGGLQLRHDPRRASRRPGEHLLWHVHSALRFFASDVYWRARRMRGYA
jgi:GT2 family glycosyltransferase